MLVWARLLFTNYMLCFLLPRIICVPDDSMISLPPTSHLLPSTSHHELEYKLSGIESRGNGHGPVEVTEEVYILLSATGHVN
jgi:hypothetical protein